MSTDTDQMPGGNPTPDDKLQKIREMDATNKNRRGSNAGKVLTIIIILLVLFLISWFAYSHFSGKQLDTTCLECQNSPAHVQFAKAISDQADVNEAHDNKISKLEATNTGLLKRVENLERLLANAGKPQVLHADINLKLDTRVFGAESAQTTASNGAQQVSDKAEKPASTTPAVKPEAKKPDTKKNEAVKQKPAEKKEKAEAKAEKSTPAAPKVEAPAVKEEVAAEPESIACKTGFLGALSDKLDGYKIIGILTNLAVKSGTEDDWNVFPELQRFQATRVIDPGLAYTKSCYPAGVPKQLICVNPIVKGDATHVAVDANSRIKKIEDPEYAIDADGEVAYDLRVGFGRNDNALKTVPFISSYKRVKMNGIWCAVVPAPNS